MSVLGRFWQRFKAAVEGEATTIEATFTELEQKLLPGFSALVHKIEHTIGAQGLTILEQAMGDIAKTIESGGNIGTIIPTVIAQVTADIKGDLSADKDAFKQDAATAAHGALELLVAALPVPAASNTGGTEGSDTGGAGGSAA